MATHHALAAQAAPRPLAIAYRPIASLVPDPRNARTHPRRQIEQIKASITAFGFTNPILTDEHGNLIAGHGRLLAARELQLTDVPVIELAGLSEPQKRALRLADNKIALNAGWDIEILKLELADLSLPDIDIDLSLTGFASGEIDVILKDADDPDDEVIPAVPTTPRTQMGDIWQLGEHRIGCGDGRDPDLLAAVIGDGQIDAAFLDPPYNVKINGHANAKGRHREFAMASGEMTTSAFRTFLEETLGACVAVSRPGAVHFVCMDWRHMDDVSHAGSALYDDLLNICVWNKSNAGMGSLYRSKHEMVFVYRVAGASHYNAVELGRHGRNRTNVWDYASVNSMRGSRREDLALHPTVKPVAMVADAICDVTRQGDLVLDIFLGSGTSLIAAERVGRRFRQGCRLVRAQGLSRRESRRGFRLWPDRGSGPAARSGRAGVQPRDWLAMISGTRCCSAGERKAWNTRQKPMVNSPRRRSTGQSCRAQASSAPLKTCVNVCRIMSGSTGPSDSPSSARLRSSRSTRWPLAGRGNRLCSLGPRPNSALRMFRKKRGCRE